MEQPQASSSDPPPKALAGTSTNPNDRPITTAATRQNSWLPDGAPAICRICRGEGTEEEPLFYPCKCSGSIKFVHQECLMEWLSHSQKKNCELCKTPFRFTKLYAPDMPQSLPLHVFLEHMARYIFRNVLAWARAALAICVWVCWLPYFMRSVWSFLFWISDQGFGSSSVLTRVNQTATSTYELSAILGMETCPASPLFVPRYTSDNVAGALLSGPPGQNMSEFLMRILLGSLGVPLRLTGGWPDSDSHTNETKASDSTTYTNGTVAAGTTLLGNVQFLRNLTPNQTVNRTITSVLEGQIITILVIVCFILVILVRDYVVQQQPEINMRAAFAAPEDIPQVGAQPGEQAVDVVPVAEEPRLEQELGPEPEASAAQAQPVGELAPANDPAETEQFTDGDGAAEGSQPLETASTATLPSQGMQAASHRMNPPADGILTPQTQTDDQPDTVRPEEERASVNDYLRIYRQAAGDSARILQIIEEENLQEKLKYWVDITKRSIRESNGLQEEVEGGSSRAAGPSGHRPGSSASGEGSSTAALTPSSSERFASEIPADDQPVDQGKGKVNQESRNPADSYDLPSSTPVSGSQSSRPRAASDGPQPSSQANPLASNSWSFNALAAMDASEGPAFPQGEDVQPTSENLSSPSAGVGNLDNPSTPSARESERETSPRVIADTRHLEPREHAETEPANANIAAQGQIAEPGAPHDDFAENIGEPALVVGEGNFLLQWVNKVLDFMWQNVPEQEDFPEVPEDDPAIAEVRVQRVQDAPVPQEPPEVGLAEDPAEGNAPDLDAGAAEPGLDPEAIDDLEDFEGVMELVGMRGPIAGLFQNAIFCGVLVTVTIFACVFIPYNIGRLSIWVTANPTRLARILFEVSKLVQDAAFCVAGFCSWFVINLIDIFASPIGGKIASHVLSARKASWTLWTGAGSRVVECLFLDLPMSASEIQNFSAVSHDALITVKGRVGSLVSLLDGGLGSVMAGNVSLSSITNATTIAVGTAANLSKSLMDPNSWVLDFSETEAPGITDPALAYWPGTDRFWAILAGYSTVFLFGAIYLARGAQFSRGSVMQAWEAGVIDTLHQASGIIKVILIISIEMLVFPLYCGLLLDAALLPLFEGATFKSRMIFTCEYPLTSIFVHWFVGTGYMFHFALFVSMCRKIMRPGVLYFIRDPDDPEFHPVRDVLERNLTTQLRKILFSAFVYGALVIVCLGGVVWGLSWSMPSVLPIHYSSNEPVLEFPVDLLFYNFLMPLAVKFFKPSDGLHTMYTWWFRKCARGLHLTFFLFGERCIDEEGTLQLAPDSVHHRAPQYRKVFLELDHTNQVIPKTWKDTFQGGNDKPSKPPHPRRMNILRNQKKRLVNSNQLVEEGHFVRAPASDRVKIPKGQKVFIPVDDLNARPDGEADDELYASESYQVVYIPPHFRFRLFLFILYIWLFAAVTGVGLTIIPLMFGRTIFKSLIPDYIRTNDIYAFSIGIYLLGTAAYSLYHARRIWQQLQERLGTATDTLKDGGAGAHVVAATVHTVQLVYAYLCLIVFFPLLLSGLMELYIAMPLHTYMHPPTAASIQASTDQTNLEGRHTVRLIQAWTLGLLYMKLGTKLITSAFRGTRLAAAVAAVLRRGWLHPDIGVLTRAFVVPGIVVSLAAVVGPPAMTSLVIKVFLRDSYGRDHGPRGTETEEAALAARTAILYRASYPMAALATLMLRNAAITLLLLRGWSGRIRDEAYLIGERLHNFGVVSDATRRGRAGWKSRGARL